MGLVVKRKKGIYTVGEMILALGAYPKDLPLDSQMQTFQIKPQKGEVFDDRRGSVCIESGNSWED